MATGGQMASLLIIMKDITKSEKIDVSGQTNNLVRTLRQCLTGFAVRSLRQNCIKKHIFARAITKAPYHTTRTTE